MISFSDLSIIVLTALVVALGTSALAVTLLVLSRQASVLLRLAIVVLASNLSIAGGTIAVASSMYISQHDFVVLLWVIGVAALVSQAMAAILGIGLVRSSRRLMTAARSIGSGHIVGVSKHDSGELTALASELARTSQRLAEAREKVQRLDDSRRQFIAWISHDLRTPLAALKVMAEALEDGLTDDPPRYYRQLRVQADTLTHLVDDLFQLSTIQAHGLRLEPVTLSVYDLVSDSVADLGPLAATRGINLNESQSGDLTIWGDARELSRAVRNLLVNAIDHSPQGGSILVIAKESAGNRVTLSVIDEGGGIPEADLGHIFDAGWRGTTSRTPPTSSLGSTGAGLGLAIVHGIVSAHSGEVSVRNTATGCRFDVELPHLRARTQPDGIPERSF